jgi:nucleotide sugar dehydrogenase
MGRNWGIIGAGVVGRATGDTIKHKLNEDVLYFDANKDLTCKEICTNINRFDDFVDKCHTIFICVPTPYNEITIVQDTHLVSFYACKIASRINETGMQTTIVQRSTCPPSTADSIVSKLKCYYADYIVMPEFLSEKTALQDSLNPSRIVASFGKNGHLPESLVRLVSTFSCPLYLVSRRDAEAVKMLSNYMLSLYISFWNEAYMLGEDLCDDLNVVMNAVCEEPNLHNPKRVYGKAYGGKCLPKDTKALLSYARSRRKPMPLLSGCVQVNETMRSMYGERKESLSEMKKEGLL